MAATSIEWTQVTWNPVTGCDRVSPGCDHCYAQALARRLKAMGQRRYQADGNPRTSGPGFRVTLQPDALDLPLRRPRPARIFVNSMSDLFHRDVPDEYIAQVFAVMALAGRHTFQILTKRHSRMRSLLSDGNWRMQVAVEMERIQSYCLDRLPQDVPLLPLPNTWIGVSAEDQRRADLRVPALAATPAAVRFISAEPLLGPLGPVDLREIDWLIIGGESGPGARPLDPGWARDLIAACRHAGTAVFVKQLGTAWARSHGLAGQGARPDTWPADLRVREYPVGSRLGIGSAAGGDRQ
jgi:protein gp37